MQGRSSHLSPLQLMPSLTIEQKHLQLLVLLSIIQTTNFLLLFFCFCVEKNPSNQSDTTFGQLPILYCFLTTLKYLIREHARFLILVFLLSLLALFHVINENLPPYSSFFMLYIKKSAYPALCISQSKNSSYHYLLSRSRKTLLSLLLFMSHSASKQQ